MDNGQWTDEAQPVTELCAGTKTAFNPVTLDKTGCKPIVRWNMPLADTATGQRCKSEIRYMCQMAPFGSMPMSGSFLYSNCIEVASVKRFQDPSACTSPYVLRAANHTRQPGSFLHSLSKKRCSPFALCHVRQRPSCASQTCIRRSDTATKACGAVGAVITIIHHATIHKLRS